LVDVTTVARPCAPDRGSIIEYQGRSGQRAVIAAVPFAKPSDLVSATVMAGDETPPHQRYADGMRRIVEILTTCYRADSVNLLLAHTHLDAAVLAGSERRVHLGEEWAATAQALPANAHYVGLGHIHRPQAIAAASAPTRYAGSPLQLDFGEIGQEKSLVVIRAEPGQPARVEQIRYDGGKPLCEIRMTLAELERQAETLRHAGWLRVTVPIEAADPDLNRKVRQLLGSAAVTVDYELPQRDEEKTPEPRRTGLCPADLFGLYRKARYGSPPESALTAAFNDLLRRAEEVPE
jgi:exonuclease SbcD